jgi:hypothetical protein
MILSTDQPFYPLNEDIPVDKGFVFCRRSGLVWEIRPVNRDQRIQEAKN